jgi:hypothetical protein
MLQRIAAGFVLTITCLIVPSAADEISFNREIRPILSDTCFFCHGPDSEHREADLRLDVEEIAKDYSIVPGDADASEIIARITSDDPDLRMPPADSGKRLTAEQIKLLTRWVEQGALYEPYWAYVPPRPHQAPMVDSDWPRGHVDAFILSALQSQNLEPSSDTDPSTLIRRVTFDLTGLPPTLEEVEEFVADPSPRAFRKVVDRLLASPAFGERLAIYWLDLVRYADTVGYHGDQDHNASPYRDYVIEALNDDTPLDEFTREQLAGDLLPEPTESQRIATGYNRLLQTSHEGGVQPKEYLAIYAADRIRNLSNVWMGATVGCAQCHDHKYDPYTTKDFYSMVALFADIDEQQHFKLGSNNLPTRRPPEIPVLSGWQRGWLTDVESRISELRSTSAEDKSATGSANRPLIARLESERDAIKKLERVTMVTEAIEPREIRVLPRGNWLDDSGPIVEPAIPEFLGRLDTSGRRANRLDLANWLVDTEQGVGGMTARVFANRFWYLLFGRGISSSLDDFGGQGQPPTHPELLDQLAIDFVEDRWSVKRLIRRLVLSRTYRQSSVASQQELRTDPENRWFARQSRYRLAAEMVRDNTLSISGILVSDVGGASIKPHQPAGYYRHLNFPKRLYTPDREQGQYRRGVYVHWQRQFLHPMLKALDAPSREECTAARPRSNTPLEALVMLNDPSMIDAAIGFASRMLKQTVPSQRARLARGFMLALSRKPDDFEMAALAELLHDEQKYYRAHRDEAEALVDTADDFIDVGVAEPAELAAWTSVARAILNTYETMTRN